MRRNVAILLFDKVELLDCALHAVARLLGVKAAEAPMRYMEYGRFAQVP